MNWKMVAVILVLTTSIAAVYQLSLDRYYGSDEAVPVSEPDTNDNSEQETEAVPVPEAEQATTPKSTSVTTDTTSRVPVTPSQVVAPAVETSQTKPLRDEDGYYIVRYTSSGFEPFTVDIKLRDTVRFINESSRPMWVTAHDHPTAEDQYYPSFNQPHSVPKGGEYVFTFIDAGVWGYKNLLNEKHLGAVVVSDD